MVVNGKQFPDIESDGIPMTVDPTILSYNHFPPTSFNTYVPSLFLLPSGFTEVKTTIQIKKLLK